MNNHYLAFTIGPIYATLDQARKTRELWAGSYIFSALMRELLKTVGSEGTVLSPVVAQDAAKNGAGIYPDRCFISYKSAVSTDTVKTMITSALKEINMLLDNAARDWLKDYFRIYAALVEEKDLKPGESPVLRLNTILDALELQAKVWQKDNDLIDVLDSKIENLYTDGLGNAAQAPFFVVFDGGRQKRLLSLIELATSELKRHDSDLYKTSLTDLTNKSVIDYQRERKNNKKKAGKEEKDSEEQAIISLKNTFGNQFKFRHKYLCFVKADGDNMGKTLEIIGADPVKINTFSDELGKFAKKAVDEIAGFGGIPVYAGGDDLLFIAPLQNERNQNIFELIDLLGKTFPDKALSATTDGKKTPSISFGISVSYYKYPMAEALTAADQQLFLKAKSVNGKNAVAFSVQKHSGQTFETAFAKDGESFKKFTHLLKVCADLENSFLTSVMHKLTEMKHFLEDALKHDQTTFFFKHHFNEQVHKRDKFNSYLTAVRELSEASWKESGNDISLAVGQVFAALRFVQFLNQEDHE